MAELSIVGAGALICSGKCSYCSATSVQECDYEGKNIKKEDFGKIIWDWDAVKKIFDTNPIVQEALQKNESLTLNWWAAEPLDFYQDAERYFDWVAENYPTLKFKTFISTNGIPLARKKVVEWVYKMHEKYGLELQISHDGVGQRVRTRSFDPFYSPSTKDIMVQLVKDGILTMVNATLNQYNCSPMANFAYFQKWRYDNHLEHIKSFYLIKLNHNNDAEYTGPFRLRDENLDRYMHEMEILWMNSYMADINDDYWRPYKGYFENQMKRWQLRKGESGCEMFSKGHRKWNWAFNTKGEYVFCQLCSDPETNPNPNCEQSEACKFCEFRDYDDCHPCPDMVQSKECHYKKAYIRTTLRMKEFCSIVDRLRKENKDLKNQLNQKNNSCSCNNKQQDKTCNASFYGVPTVWHP